MKKSILLLLAILLLAGCSSTEKPVEQNKASNTITKISEGVKEYATLVVSELPGEEYYLTDGIVALALNDDSKLSNDSQTTIYPVYCDDELVYVIVESEELTAIEVDSSIKSYLEKDSAIVEVDGNLYVVNDKSSVLLYGNEKSDDMAKLKKINGLDYILSLCDSKKEKIPVEKELINSSETVFVDGLEYSNSRIIVQFVEGDINSQIADFEKFCNGKLKSALDSVAIYVFTFDALDADALLDLLDDALALDYVQNAELDGVVHTWNSDNTVAY